LVGHPQAEAAVQFGAVAWVGVAEQAEQVSERFGYGVELVAGHPLGWLLGEAEPGLSGFLDLGGFGDPAGDERRVAARVERRAVAADLGVGVSDGPAQTFDLASRVVSGLRGPVLRVGDPAGAGNPIRAGQAA